MIVAIVILFIIVILLTIALIRMYNLFGVQIADLWIYKEDNELGKERSSLFGREMK